MATRFRKSIKVAPGVRININKNSVGVSAGVKGARVSANTNGRVTKSVGIPGTGIYNVETTNVNGKSYQQSAVNLGRTKVKKPHTTLWVVLAVVFLASGIYGLAIGEAAGGILCVLIGLLFIWLMLSGKAKMQGKTVKELFSKRKDNGDDSKLS